MNKRMNKRFGSLLLAGLMVLATVVGGVTPVYAEVSGSISENDQIIYEGTESANQEVNALHEEDNEGVLAGDGFTDDTAMLVSTDESEKISERDNKLDYVSDGNDESVSANDTDDEEYDDFRITLEGAYNGPDLTNPAYDSSFNPYARPQCTWYCYGRVKEKLGITMPTLWGDAKDWKYLAEQNGLHTGNMPAENSIMVMDMGSCYNTGHAGVHGHVAFVEYLNGSTMRITDGNAIGIDGYAGRDIPAYKAGDIASASDYLSCPTCYAGYPVLGYIYFGSVSYSPVGHIDSASGGDGKVYVGGWAYDPDSTSTKIQVNLYIDGISGPVASFKTHIYRQIAGGTYCGFAETIDVSKYNLKGKKKIHLWGIDATGDDNAEIGTAEITMGKEVTGSQSPIGHIDSASGGVGIINVGGWAYDPDSASTKIQVNLYVEGYNGPVASFKTHVFRQIAGGTYCGFDEIIDVSTYDFSGKKKIHLWGIDATGNENAEIGTAEINITKKIRVTGVTLNKSATTLTVGKSETLSATVSPSNATDKSIKWISNNPNIASVGTGGVVTAKSTGTAIITVQTADGNKMATCKVTVNPANVSVTGVSIKNKSGATISNINVVKGKTETLTAAVAPSNATNKNATWSSSNTSVATVNSSGVVTAKTEGTTNITVKTSDGGKSATCKVTVVAAPTITTTSLPACKLGEPYYFQLQATNNPTRWNIILIDGHPRGMSVDKTKGIIRGTPTELYPSGIIACAYNDFGKSEEKTFTLPVEADPPEIITDSLPYAAVGVSYYAKLNVKNQRNDGNGWIYNFDEWINGGIYKDADGDYAIRGVPKKAGTFKFTLRHDNGFGVAEKEFTVNVKDLIDGQGDIGVVGITDKEYTGSPITQTFEVYNDTTLLDNNVDYSVKYANNTKAYTLSEGDHGFDSRKAPSVIITGKGNYKSKETVYFRILPQDISGADFSAYDIVLGYNKKSQKVAPILYWKGSTLKKGTDYTVNVYRSDDIEYSTSLGESVKDAGDYIVRLTGKGNFTGVREVGLKVSNEYKPVSKLSVGKIANVRYTGDAITPEPVIKDGNTVLVKDTHYTLSYTNNIDIGTGYVIVTGRPEAGYSGTRRIAFKIAGTALRKATVSGIQKSYAYTGNEITINNETLKLYIKATEKTPQTDLVRDRDYTVSYLKNTNAGTATVVLTGMGGYTGTVKKTFRITPFKLAEDNGARFVTACPDMVEYSKAGAKPDVAVTFKNVDGTVQILTPGTDYTLVYMNNKTVSGTKTPTVIVRGKGNFAGSRSIAFAISKKDLSKITISAADKTYQNKAGVYKTTVTLTDNGRKLSAGKDYDKTIKYTYVNNTEVQTGSGTEIREAGSDVGSNDIIPQGTVIRVTVTAADTSGYTGTTNTTYRITRSSIGSAKISVPTQVYTGEEVKPAPETITVRVGTNELRPYNEATGEGDFIITGYSNNVKKGTARLTIRGTGNYGGTKTANFTIGAKGIRWWWR